MRYKYATKNYDKENMARVVGKSLPISTKFSIEICNFIRNKTTSEAKEILQKVAEKKQAIPFKIFKRELSHKRKIGPGRYPKKSAIEIINLLESVEANAQFKGLNTSALRITHINAHLASRPWRYGRQRRRKAKRTHLEIIVEEKKAEEKQKEAAKEKKETPKIEKAEEKPKEAPKVEEKKEVPKEEKPKIEEKKVEEKKEEQESKLSLSQAKLEKPKKEEKKEAPTVKKAEESKEKND